MRLTPKETMEPMEIEDRSLLLAGVVTLIFLGLVYHHIKRFSFWSSRGIKGPTPWPFLGTQIYYIIGDKIKVDQEWRKKYGHTYGIYEGYRPSLRTSDINLIKHVFVKEFSSFTDRDIQFVYGDGQSRWMFWSKGQHWSNQRALVTPMFTSSKIKSFYQQMSNCIDRFLQEVNARLAVGPTDQPTKGAATTAASRNQEDKMPVKRRLFTIISKAELMALTLDVIATSFFSIKLNTYRDKTSDFFKRAYAFASFEVSYFIFYSMLPAFVCKYFQIDLIRQSKFEYFEKLSQSKIDERRNNPSKARQHDFVQVMLDARISDSMEKVYTEEDDLEAHYNDSVTHNELERIHEGQRDGALKFKKFDDLEIRSLMTFFFLAGFEATSSSLAFCFYELAHQQTAQEELYQELIKCLSGLSIGGTNNDHQPTVDYSSLLNLTKLDAFVSETLRLYSPVTEHNRMVTAEGGVTLPMAHRQPVWLPEGTGIHVPGMVVQRDSDYWDEPLKFDMSRFYPENRHKIKSCSYVPFGVGPRYCAGMRFALLEIKLCLVKLLLKYQVRPGPQSAGYPAEFKPHFFFAVLKHTDFRLFPRQ